LKFAVTRLIKDQDVGWRKMDNHSEYENEMDAIIACEELQELMKESPGVNYGVEPI